MYAKFGYDAKMEGYTTLMLDIPKLGEIALLKNRRRVHG